MPKISLDSLDLSALLCSRVCHDVISPVGAIVNGLEVLEDEKDTSMRDFAFELIRKSAQQASARLQFSRLAFGAAGSAGSMIDLGDAEQVSRGLFPEDKVTVGWNGPAAYFPKNKVKLLLNLVMITGSAIPRGGHLEVTVEGTPESCEFTLTAKGPNARINKDMEALLSGESESGSVDAHGIQAFYAGMVAQASKMAISVISGENEVTVRATQA
ncbi:histidine phosphotransferase family protein [Microvirga sp. W0021]|uniref:Histidine phosphotransferase family protein n=1 Tax=Hohaiivirga grylli TaxID=3133970 RepID=A0ABV0BGE8_9HYPH